MKTFELLFSRFQDKSDSLEKGAITLVETLIALTVGIVVLAVWTQSRLSQMEVDNARNAGRAIATYARAASTWLAESPPTSGGVYSIDDLQDCNNPIGRRFLSCTFGPETLIPYVRTDAGIPASYRDLEIEVSITPSGTLGLIDFGVFRSGDDDNNDGQPDSRPDLAAAAFQTATEQTGAGVLNFFELVFAEPDPATVIIDPNHPNYDTDAVDDLARLQARVGAQATGNAPFLRVDGANEMTGALSFDNGMQVNMDADNLIVQGPGDVAIQTVSGKLVVPGQVDTRVLQASAAQINQLRVDPADGVSGEGFERFNQAPDVVRIDNEIRTVSSQVTENRNAIGDNTEAIANNRRDIRKNFADLVDLSGKVDINTTNIAANRLRIGKNASDISKIVRKPTANQSCTPSRASVISANPGRLSCGGSCRSCGSWRGTSKTFTYKSRNLETLKCDNHSIKIYSSCCLVSNGNCDGWCEHGVVKC